MNDWVSQLGPWIEHHPGDAAWVQAIGATLAVIAAVLVPALQARHAQRQRDADRRLRAKSLAMAIYPNLLHIRVEHLLIRRRLIELMRQAEHPDGRSAATFHGADLVNHTKRLSLPVAAELRAMIPEFYLLGEPLGPQVQQCIGRSMKHNDILNTLSELTARVDLSSLLSFIEEGLHQATTCIAAIERTWGLTAEQIHAFEDLVTRETEPAPVPARDTISKETV